MLWAKTIGQHGRYRLRWEGRIVPEPGCRAGDVPAGNPQNGAVEVFDGFTGQHGGDFGARARAFVGLVSNNDRLVF
jgi:hypothetical protein